MRQEDVDGHAEKQPVPECALPHNRARSIERAGAEAVFFNVFGGRPVPFRTRGLYGTSTTAIMAGIGAGLRRPRPRA